MDENEVEVWVAREGEHEDDAIPIKIKPSETLAWVLYCSLFFQRLSTRLCGRTATAQRWIELELSAWISESVFQACTVI